MEPDQPLKTGNPAAGRDDPPARDWRADNALGLPGGSVRALLALVVFGTIWWWLYRRPDREVPTYLRDLLFIVMGHYFAARRAKAGGTEPDEPHPLFLPKGTIRSVLLLGFAGVGVALYVRDGIRVNDAWLTLVLVAGFMLGVVARTVMGGRRLPRVARDLTAVAALAAGVMLALLVLGVWQMPEHVAGLQKHLVRYRVEDILAAVVGFYFGSRS